MRRHDVAPSGSGRPSPLAGLLGPVGPEVSCERCFELLDQYVDLELAGEDPGVALRGMRAHLEGCPACNEDYRSLHELVRDSNPRRGEGRPS